MTGQKFLFGKIDTIDEVNIILDQLKELNFLNFKSGEINIQNALSYMKQVTSATSNFIQGDVDTPKEVSILLGYLRREGKLLQGVLDTEEEVKEFMNLLQKRGFYSPSFKEARNFKESTQVNPPKTKRAPRPTPFEEDDD